MNLPGSIGLSALLHGSVMVLVLLAAHELVQPKLMEPPQHTRQVEFRTVVLPTMLHKPKAVEPVQHLVQKKQESKNQDLSVKKVALRPKKSRRKPRKVRTLELKQAELKQADSTDRSVFEQKVAGVPKRVVQKKTNTLKDKRVGQEFRTEAKVLPQKIERVSTNAALSMPVPPSPASAPDAYGGHTGNKGNKDNKNNFIKKNNKMNKGVKPVATGSVSGVRRSYYRAAQRLLKAKRMYPRVARRAGKQGLVVLEVTIDAQGFILSARVKRTSGHAILDRAAMKAVRALGRFPKPPVVLGWRKHSFSVPMRFRLR